MNLLVFGQNLFAQVSWRSSLVEFILEMAEYIFRKVSEAIFQSRLQVFIERFSEKDVIKFLVFAALISTIFITYILYRRNK